MIMMSETKEQSIGSPDDFDIFIIRCLVDDTTIGGNYGCAAIAPVEIRTVKFRNRKKLVSVDIMKRCIVAFTP